MERIIDVANYIINRYKEISGETIDEMKLHKLLYYTQRESYAILNRPAFEGIFEGWIHGPVCKEVRMAFLDGCLNTDTNDINEDIKYIADNVIYEYGPIESWKLSQMSHLETSWMKAREGLAPDAHGSVVLKEEDIKTDSLKVRPYDHLWDMYYDEFEDEHSFKVG